MLAAVSSKCAWTAGVGPRVLAAVSGKCGWTAGVGPRVLAAVSGKCAWTACVRSRVLAAVSGKAESIIPCVYKYIIIHICSKVYMFQFLFCRLISLLGKICYIRECRVKHW